jgi:hypothetical protein
MAPPTAPLPPPCLSQWAKNAFQSFQGLFANIVMKKVIKKKKALLVNTSVACVCWPKCELITQLIFPFKTIFGNLIEFLMKKIFKFQYLPNLRSNFFQITFIKSYSSKAFL